MYLLNASQEQLTTTDQTTYLELLAQIKSTAQAVSNGIIALGGLLKTMRDSKLYEQEYDSWEEFCLSLNLPGFKQLSFQRANQIILAADTQQFLLSALDQKMYGENILSLNENTIRQLRSFPADDHVEIIQNVFDESAVTGVTPNSKLVAQVAADSGLSFEEIADQYKHLGVFQRHIPVSRKTQKYRFVFEAEGKTSLFETLGEAEIWLDQYANKTVETLSCLSCVHHGIDERCSDEEIFCNLKNYTIHETRVQIMPDICNAWSSDTRRLTLIPASIPVPTQPKSHPKDLHPAGVLASGAGRGDKDEARDERYTPDYLWQPGLDMFEIPAYDLDPATCADSPVPARIKYTKEDDGLSKPWIAKYLFANFPFALNLEFVEKLIEEYMAGNVENAIICLKTDHRTKWYNLLALYCTCICSVNRQVQFLGTDHSSFFGISLFYFGDDLLDFFKSHQHLGFVNQNLIHQIPIKDQLPRIHTKWTNLRIRQIWRKVGKITARKKYNGGFLIENNDLAIYYEFQTHLEAWNAWIRDEQSLLEKLR